MEEIMSKLKRILFLWVVS